MLRAMILVLTLLLVTLSAAYLGQDEQLTQVLRLSKTPVSNSSSKQPVTSSSTYSGPSSSQTPSSSSESSSSSPRFVLDEPLTNPPPISDSESQSSSEDSLPDPSAHAQLYSTDDKSSESYEPIPPSEEEKLAAAEPYVKELFELKDRNVRAFSELADEALSEYLGTAPDRRSASFPDLMEKYLPRVNELEEESDAQSEVILLKMEAALAAIGADDSIVQDARSAYEHSKEEQLSHYTELFASLPS